MIGVQLIGLVYVFAVAWWLGKREERRLGLTAATSGALPVGAAVTTGPVMKALTPEQQRLRRPHLFWPNLLITVLVLGVMISGWVDPVVMFMLGTAAALILNFRSPAEQRARIDAHAKAALLMAAILLAAGSFTGIMAGTGMLRALAEAAVAVVPAGAGHLIPAGIGLLSMPLSLLFDPDSYYFGVLPVVAEVYHGLGGQPIEVAQASLLGQMTVGFPVSTLTPATFLIVGLAGIELRAHQLFSIPWLFGASVLMTVAAVVLGILPI
jgi:CitMHS family citrate-Mg2+:H+ or citrate-Ca2+:H+ symporter